MQTEESCGASFSSMAVFWKRSATQSWYGISSAQKPHMKLHNTLACKITQFAYGMDTYIFLQETEIISEDLTANSLISEATFPLALVDFKSCY